MSVLTDIKNGFHLSVIADVARAQDPEQSDDWGHRRIARAYR
jgi:hypothetical protein